ncbi:MAG: sigma-54-dependent Fis family transcriptional regulator [Alphaproteobacteria bacterium]|nr:sigma-54-dependent Fis family transcriptional regulator [Alphaproteobacteria bacterium]
MPKRVLIVDDEPSIRKVLQALLQFEGFEVEAVGDGAAAIRSLQQSSFEVVITDQQMPHVGGLELLQWAREHLPAVPVILITAHGTVDAAKEAIKLGAYDYLTKPFDQDELKRIVNKAVAAQAIRDSRAEGGQGRFDIIGSTRSMERVFGLIEKVAASPSTVLITGESGTGKELVARALHSQSRRAQGPFVPVNCGAIPKELFEAELFGHEKGAYTGAHTSRPGRFELADGGTLFLDEVGELPVGLQVKLLRVLQERRFERVGGSRTVEVDVRLLAATNRDLEAAVAAGEFRQDLFYRLNVVPILLPPLRERVEDLPLLCEHFLQRFNARLGREVQGVSAEAMEAMRGYPWPGNIRELENLMERGVLLCEDEEIQLDDLPELGGQRSALGALPPQSEDLNLKDYVRQHTQRLESERIRQALAAESNNVTRAAKRLGISRKSLQTKMKEYGLREP